MPTQNIDYADKSTGGNFTAADANDIKSAVNTNAALQFINAPVLSSLPAVTASKAGELFYYNGTLWTYAKTGQFGTLAEGTPWPVKGYKEVDVLVESASNTYDITAYVNDSNMALAIGAAFNGSIQITGFTENPTTYQISVYNNAAGGPLNAAVAPYEVDGADVLTIVHTSTADAGYGTLAYLSTRVYPN